MNTATGAALKQIAAELVVLRAAVCEGDEGDGPLATDIVSRALSGIEGRARVAAEVAEALSESEAAQ
jgi:hypothetical protein